MRAKEFIVERKKISKKLSNKLNSLQANPMNPSHKFAGTADRIYDLNRAMMAVAAADHNGAGENAPSEESWTGRWNTCHPYTEEEHRMMHHAYDHLGIENIDAINSWSTEPEDSNKISPVKGFTGY